MLSGSKSRIPLWQTDFFVFGDVGFFVRARNSTFLRQQSLN